MASDREKLLRFFTPFHPFVSVMRGLAHAHPGFKVLQNIVQPQATETKDVRQRSMVLFRKRLENLLRLGPLRIARLQRKQRQDLLARGGLVCRRNQRFRQV